MVVLDTSTLLYWTLDPDKIPGAVAEVIGNADRILVSSITIWEIGVKLKRGKLEIPLSLREYVEGIAHVDRVEILAVDVPTWIESLDLDWQHRDPADRVIVATAVRHGCALVSPDAAMAGYYARTLWQ